MQQNYYTGLIKIHTRKVNIRIGGKSKDDEDIWKWEPLFGRELPLQLMFSNNNHHRLPPPPLL